MPPLIDETLQSFKARIAELQPAVDEHAELIEIVKRLEAGRPSSRRKRTAPPGGTQKAAEKAIRQRPGMSTAEVGKAIRQKPHYLYRALPAMEARGVIRRDKDKRWHPAG